MLPILLLSVAMLQPAPLTVGGWFQTLVGGEQWDFQISQETLDRAPSWSADNDGPALGAGSALVAARRELVTLGLDPDDWRLTTICLRPALHVLHFQPPEAVQGMRLTDRWLYIVGFQENVLHVLAKANDDGSGLGAGGSRMGKKCELVVLLNGEAIHPIRTVRRVQ
jgi:hypothetical protein